MERKYAQRLKKSFQQTILNTPVPKLSYSKKSKVIKALPSPLVPTKYKAPQPAEKPVPKPRVPSKRPVPVPRSSPYPKPNKKEVKKFIDFITPYFRPEAIRKFDQELRAKENLRVRIKEKDRAFKNNVKSFEVAIIERRDATEQLAYTSIDVARELENLLSSERGLKANVTLKILMKKQKIDENGEVYFIPYFRCKTFTMMNSNVIMNALDQAAEEITYKIAGWLSEGSGWKIENIQHHYVDIVKYVPFKGISYIPLPEELRHHKKGLINLKKEDDKCAIWCHVRHLNPQKKNPQRIKISDREFAKGLDCSGINFPVTSNQIPQIERQNKININVFGYSEKRIFPIYVSDAAYTDHMELLYIDDQEKQHYVYIKDFNRLMYNFTKHKGRKHFCMHCLQCFIQILV